MLNIRCDLFKRHNVAMFEKLDQSGTKIIPYCGYCECNKELQQIISKRGREYQKELEQSEREYQKDLEKYQKELLKPRFLSELPLYLIGIVFLGLGIFLAYSYFEPGNEPITLVGVKLYGKTARLIQH